MTPPHPLSLTLRSRREDTSGSIVVEESDTSVNPNSIAVIICDMWNAHWCAGATRRVAEIAPAMNRLGCSLRDSGALIIHAPSETMPHYLDTPARFRAQNAPPIDTSYEFTRQPHDSGAEGTLPIDDSDGGCDDDPVCPIPSSWPWSCQIAAIDVHDVDAVTDSGAEVHNLLHEYGTEMVLMMGVHTNMCILARPFGIRRLVQSGRKVALVRDMTDAMYNSGRRPFVNHFRGTDLVVEHIERYWCPTITSDQIVGGIPFRFAEDAG